MINTDALRGSASAYTSFVTLSADLATPMATASTSVAIRDSSAVLTITSRSDEIVDNKELFEGCLSIPKFYGEVERAERVTVRGLNRRQPSSGSMR